MATTLSNLLALLALDPSAYLEGLADSQAAADTFGSKLSSVGGAVVLGGLTAAATATVAIGTAAFDAAETVDTAMDKIAVATGAQGTELDKLRKDFETVFQSVPTDADSAATAIGILSARLDISGKSLQSIAGPLLEATRIMGGDLTSNAESFTRVVGDWNIPVDQASGSLDQLFVAAQSSGVPLDALMQRIVQYGAPMRNFGFNFAESAALLAQWEAQGVNVETVMGGMRIAQGNFIKDGVDMKTGLWNTVNAIQNASSATEGLSIATKVFGAKAAGDMFDTIVSGKFDIDQLVASMSNADGAIMDSAKATMDWGEQWTVFKNNVTTTLAPIGDKVREGMGSAMDEMIAIFERPDIQASITKIVEAIIQFIDLVVSKVPDMINGILSFIQFLQNNQGIVVGIFAALGVAVVAWGVVTAAAAWSAVVPFLPVIAVLLAVAAAAYLIYEAWTNNWGGIQEKTQAVFQFITDAVNAFIAFFGPAIQAALEVVRFYWEYWSAQIKAIIELFSLAMQGRWYEFGQKLREIFDNFLNAIKTVWTAAWDFIKNIPTTVMDIFKNTDWLAVGTGIIQGIANGITSGVGFIVDAAVAAAEAALEAAMGFLGINSPSTVFEKQVGMQMAAGVAKGWENGVKDLVSPSMANIDPAKVNIRPIGLQNANPQGSAPAVRQQSQNASHTIIINNPVPEKSDASVRRALRHVSYTGVA